MTGESAGASPRARRCCTHDRVKTLAAALLTSALVASCADIECSINSECGQRARCEMNRCIRECAEDRDCEDGFTCNRNGLCVEATKPTSDRPEPRDMFTPADRGAVDVGADVRTDAGGDAGTTVDVGTDMGFDAGMAIDAGMDTGIENRPDVGFDVGFDSGFDVGFPDRGVDVPIDAGARDSGSPDVPVVTGPVPIGAYEYTAVRPDALSAPVAVAWHPSGAYALMLSYNNGVFRYDASMRAVTRVGTTANDVYWRDVTFTPDGARAMLLANTTTTSGGTTSTRGRIFIWDHAASMLAERTAEAWTMGRYESLRWSPDGTRAVLLGQGTNAFYIWRYDAAGTRTGLVGARAVVARTGCNDLAWVRDNFRDPMLAVVCGTNTGEIVSVTSIDATSPTFMTAASSGQTGNVHRIAGRPQGDLALAIGSSSQKLYRYRDSVWSVGFSSPELRGAFSVAFSTDGARALAYGGFGRAHEYRYDLYASAEIIDVSIGDLATAFGQPSGAQLNGVAWRPGCHAGLAVGGQNTFSGTTAFVAYFRVLNGARCADDP